MSKYRSIASKCTCSAEHEYIYIIRLLILSICKQHVLVEVKLVYLNLRGREMMNKDWKVGLHDKSL